MLSTIPIVTTSSYRDRDWDSAERTWALTNVMQLLNKLSVTAAQPYIIKDGQMDDRFRVAVYRDAKV